MKKVKTRVKSRLFILLLILCSISTPESVAQGLKFTGNLSAIDKRTSCNVFGKHTKNFKDSFTIKFKLSLYPPYSFGYIFRICDGASGRIWNFSYQDQGDTLMFRLNEEGRYSLIKAEIPQNDMQYLHWHDISISFDLKTSQVILSIAGKSFDTQADELPNKMKLKVVFGKSDHIIDVPTFAIRDLKISDSYHCYEFPLDENKGNRIHDKNRIITGFVENPYWLINESTDWNQFLKFSSEDIAGAAYNRKLKEFYYYDRKHFWKHSLLLGTSENNIFINECPVQLKLGLNFIDQNGDFLYTYEIYDDLSPEGSPTIAKLNLKPLEWEVYSTSHLHMPMHHHATFFEPNKNEFMIFGGFGNMLYNGNFYALNPDTKKWEKRWENSRRELYPRYFTSAGVDGNYLYIFGGMGNQCGEQVVGRQYFYDLHRINMLTGEGETLWSLKWEGDNVVPVRNLIVDDEYFFTLCYPEYKSSSELYLYKFSIKDGSYKKLCNSIPIVSDKMRTNANIYLDKDLNTFFTTVQVFEDDISSTLEVYSLAYPPIDADTLNRGFMYFWPKWMRLVFFLSLILFLGLIAILIININRKKQKVREYISGTKRVFKTHAEPNSISLFGDFRVIDKYGNLISTTFSHQQKQILCLLIQRFYSNGISSRRLSNILWPDKDEDKVKNSRGVAINSLRKSLSKLDGVNVVYREGRYYLETEAVFYCDYLKMIDLLNAKEMDIKAILDIFSQGKFLNFMNDPIFDEFKENIENKLLPILYAELERRFGAKDVKATVEISDMLLSIDPLDEKALKFSVNALKIYKRTEESLVRYATFVAEYKKIYGSDYPIPFAKI